MVDEVAQIRMTSNPKSVYFVCASFIILMWFVQVYVFRFYGGVLERFQQTCCKNAWKGCVMLRRKIVDSVSFMAFRTLPLFQQVVCQLSDTLFLLIEKACLGNEREC